MEDSTQWSPIECCEIALMTPLVFQWLLMNTISTCYTTDKTCLQMMPIQSPYKRHL